MGSCPGRGVREEKTLSEHPEEVASDKRFEFGENWSRFLRELNDERIAEAERSLKKMLGVESLNGQSFLDIGSGSGLFSLAARRLGARIHSFDYDPQSVACTAELKRRYFSDDANWTVGQGSVLDVEYLRSLGKFDIVYSWGVLHHSGAMWQALENAQLPVAPGGWLFIAIYNDQGRKSVVWKRIKKLYNGLPRHLKLAFAVCVIAPYLAKKALKGLLTLQLRHYTRSWTHYHKNRGMSPWHDLIDWVGGYPFEVAKPEEIFDFYRERGFVLEKLKTAGGGLANNEFVFKRIVNTQS